MEHAGVQYEVEEVVERLKHAVKRILRTVNEARACDDIWRVLAFGGDLRKAVAASPAALAANIYERATRDNQIVMITRLLDPAGRSGALKTDRLSFLVCRDLLALPGIMERLTEAARGWPTKDPDHNAALVAELHDSYCARLQALADEDPNRAKRLRDFRDENIAHELHFEELPPRPVVRDLHNLIAEEVQLIEELSMIVDGSKIGWGAEDHAGSVTAIWEAVAKMYAR